MGISFDSVDEYADVEGPVDRFAEFEPESTILAMEAAVRFLGCTPVRVGGPRRMLTQRPDVDVIWNISEGYGTRNREAWVPVLCELYGIPCLGSDASTLSMSLDKVMTKQIARQVGIPTADWVVFPADGDFNAPNGVLSGSSAIDMPSRLDKPGVGNSDVYSSEKSGSDRSGVHLFDSQVSKGLRSMRWPLFLKPRNEGTGKGISTDSVVRRMHDLMPAVERMQQIYQQDVLVEEHLPGAEFTVALSGSPLRCHPVLERAIDPASGIGIHVLDSGYIKPTAADHTDLQRHETDSKKSNTPESQRKVITSSQSDVKSERQFNLTHALTPELESVLRDWSLALCSAMQVKDFARLDFKLDADGNPYFLEINPLPTFAVDNTYAILAELDDSPYDAFLSVILQSSIRRTLNLP